MAHFFNDEKEWIKEETKLLDRIHPFFKKHLFVKFILFVFLIFLIAKYHKLFVTLLCFLGLSYVQFKRKKHGINIEIEPSYLFTIAIAIAFGIEYGFLLVLLPFIFGAFIYGFNGGSIVNFLNKVAFLLLVYFFWLLTPFRDYIVFFATAIVLLTDIIGLFLRKKLGQPMIEIIQVILTNTIFRYIYFSIFLDVFVYLIET